MFRSCQIIIREFCSLLKLCYSIHNSIRICKRGVVAAYLQGTKLPDDDLTGSKHVGVFLKCFKSFLCEIICAFFG